jgi:hypothetical protein
VSQDSSAEHPTGARPVADAPVDELLAAADELARRWALSLIAARPLSDMAGVPLDELAGEAPELCAQLARALSSDGELAQLLEPVRARGRQGAGRADSPWVWIARANDVASAVRDVELLRRVVWEATLGALRDASVGQVADLSDRLAFVCASLLVAVLSLRESGLGETAVSAPTAPGREHVLYSTPQDAPGGRRAVLIDELEDAVVVATRGVASMPPAEPEVQRSVDPTAGERASGGSLREPARQSKMPRARPWDTPLAPRAEAERVPSHDAPRPGDVPPQGAVVRVMRGPGASVEGRG